MTWEPDVVKGHPTRPLHDEHGRLINLLTVCSECGELRSILFLTGDRWYCSKCRAEGTAKPKLYPVN
jgi:translation initiation factor 2 beta subunit (eIF-2beta)/eIF-5